MTYDYLLNMKVKYHLKLILLTFVFIIVSGFVLTYKVYDIYEIVGISTGDTVVINVPLDYSDTIKNGEYLKINDRKYDYEILDIGGLEYDLELGLNFQSYSLKIEESFKKNEVLKIKIYYDYEKIIKKIKKIL